MFASLRPTRLSAGFLVARIAISDSSRARLRVSLPTSTSMVIPSFRALKSAMMGVKKYSSSESLVVIRSFPRGPWPERETRRVTLTISSSTRSASARNSAPSAVSRYPDLR
ncbi:hypothetical protein D3C87_1496100 [compost metagenome]